MTAAGASPAYDAWLDRLRLEPVLLDTMIVRHICAAGGGAALGRAFAGRMLFPEAVAAELSTQSRYISALAAFLAAYPATEIDIDAADEPEVEDIRVDMWTKGEARTSATKHLGESQCILLAERYGYPFATNDVRARARARAGLDEASDSPRVAGLKKVDLFHIIDVLLVCVRLGTCKPGRAWTTYEQAVSLGLYESPGFEIPTARSRFLTDASAMVALARAAKSPGS